MPPDGAGDTPAPCAEPMVTVHKHLEAKSSESEIRSVTYVCVMNGIVATVLLGQGPRTREDRSPGEGTAPHRPRWGEGVGLPASSRGEGRGARAQASLTLKARAISGFYLKPYILSPTTLYFLI